MVESAWEFDAALACDEGRLGMGGGGGKIEILFPDPSSIQPLALGLLEIPDLVLLQPSPTGGPEWV